MEEDGRVRVALELLDDGSREGTVDRDVALLPRAENRVRVRVVLELPEPVLDEPERRIRDDVVGERVRLGWIVRDEPEAGSSSRR